MIIKQNKKLSAAAMLILCAFAAVLLLTGCAPQGSSSAVTSTEEQSSESSQSMDSDVTSSGRQETDLAEYTLLIYMCGSSLETTGGFASANITEMLGAEISDGVNIIIETGGTKKWRGYGIESNEIGRYEISDGELVKVGETALSGMGDSSTLTDFVKWGTENYPAEQTSLIFWNHGGGFVKGACYDELHSGDWLTADEIVTALTACGLEKKFAFIGFDACKMACFDTAASINPFADYMIASQDLEHSGGWDYKILAESLGAEDFYDKVLTSYGAKHSSKGYYTLSCTDLSKIDRLYDTLHEIVAAVSTKDGAEKLSDALDSADIIESGSGSYYDFGAVARFYGIDADFSDIIKVENSPSKKTASGLNLMFPSDEAKLDSYLPVCRDEVYKSFLEGYFSKESAEEFCFENKGFVENGLFCFSIAPGAEKYIRKVEYELGAIDTENSVAYRMGIDNDIKQSGDTFTINFSGRWVYFGGYALNCEIMSKKNDFTVFCSPVKINGAEAKLIFTYNGASRTVKLNGYVFCDDVTGRIMTHAENDEVAVLFYDMDSDNPAEYGSFVYTADCTVEIRQLPDYYYVYQGIITDIYGNEHYTDIAVMKITDGNTEIEEIFQI